MRQFIVTFLIGMSFSCASQTVAPEQGWPAPAMASKDSAAMRVVHYLNDSSNTSIQLLPNNSTRLYEYYPSGKIRSMCFSTITIYADTLIEFDAAFQQTQSIHQYIRPVRNGYYMEFREDGSTLRDGYYFNGQKQGLWKEYDIKGQTSKSTIFIDDQPAPR